MDTTAFSLVYRLVFRLVYRQGIYEFANCTEVTI